LLDELSKSEATWELLIALCQNRALKEIGKMVKLEIVKLKGNAKASYCVMKKRVVDSVVDFTYL